MKLIVHELKTVELKQKIVIGTENIQMHAVRLHLYRHLAPAGSLQMRLLNAAGKLIVAGETITIASMPAGNYWHGYIRFLCSHQLKAGSEYYIALVGTGGYTFGSSFIGWCNDFDLKHVLNAYAPVGGVSAPLGFELWANEYQQRKGR